jgi:hypothetical protein
MVDMLVSRKEQSILISTAKSDCSAVFHNDHANPS